MCCEDEGMPRHRDHFFCLALACGLSDAPMSAALWASHDAYKGKRCGLIRSCPRQYSLTDVNASAFEWGTPAGQSHISAQAGGEQWAAEHCRGQRHVAHAQPIAFSTKAREKASGGAWCLPTDSTGTTLRGKRVELAHGQSYTLPAGHAPADLGLVKAVYRRLLAPLTPGGRPRSVIDLGSGVGQFGHALRSMHSHVDFRAFDGSGNIDALTDGFVHYADLSQPLELRPRADWVFSLEVAEHLPNQREGFYVRNLHAHNCFGILLSWGMLGQGGLSHINNHPPEYVIETFEQLGYVSDTFLAEKIYNASESAQFHRLHVFRRLQTPPGC